MSPDCADLQRQYIKNQLCWDKPSEWFCFVPCKKASYLSDSGIAQDEDAFALMTARIEAQFPERCVASPNEQLSCNTTLINGKAQVLRKDNAITRLHGCSAKELVNSGGIFICTNNNLRSLPLPSTGASFGFKWSARAGL